MHGRSATLGENGDRGLEERKRRLPVIIPEHLGPAMRHSKAAPEDSTLALRSRFMVMSRMTGLSQLPTSCLGTRNGRAASLILQLV